MTGTILSQSDLAELVDHLVAEGTSVIAPVPARDDARRTEYRPIRSLGEAALGGPLPRCSLKEFFLPPSQVLLRYRQRKDGVDLQEVPTTFAPQVILGARPCDAAGVETLDKVMGWDYRDELWFGRREATTIVSLACRGVDSSCFCHAVGLGPNSTKGADVLLVPLNGTPSAHPSQPAGVLAESVDAFLRDSEPFAGAFGLEAKGQKPPPVVGYLAEPVTPKGEALLKGRGKPATERSDLEEAQGFVKVARDRVARNFAALQLANGHLPEWLANNFDHQLWKSLALRCHGCGACAAVCSTCHCFDIVDEHDSYGQGARRRNWDSCQSAKFTLHASGHNPRQTQTERFRQRVMHKFSIYPRRFDAILCSGCGRCARICPAGMSLPEIVGEFVQLAGPEIPGSVR